jgi:membrane protein DedA with SNARE-associated domain
VSHLIATYGYWAVFALVAAECLGIPLPGETALILASAYAGSTHRLSPWVIFAVAVSAAILGDNAGFWIGATGGYRLARVHGRKVGLDDRKLKLARYLFDRHGGKVVLFGRFIVVLRTWAAFLAGASRMRWLRFLPANAAGGILWAATYTLAAGGGRRGLLAEHQEDEDQAARPGRRQPAPGIGHHRPDPRRSRDPDHRRRKHGYPPRDRKALLACRGGVPRSAGLTACRPNSVPSSR